MRGAAVADTNADGNESVLEKVDQLVDEMLGTDIVPVEPEDPWERRQRILDSWTAIILAIAAVATTWASFQASQWANAQSDAQSISAIERSDANRAASEATSQSVVDSEMWIAWVEAVDNFGRAPARTTQAIEDARNAAFFVRYCELHQAKYGAPFEPDVNPDWQ
jgi:hypothetical protein